MCCCPQCSLGPDTLRKGAHIVLCPVTPQYEFPLGTREVNHLHFMGCTDVCAVPFSEVVPFCVELTDVYSSLVSNWPFAVLGTELDILRRRVDPPRCHRGEPEGSPLKEQPTQVQQSRRRDPREKTQPTLPNNVREQDDCGELSPVGNDADPSFH